MSAVSTSAGTWRPRCATVVMSLPFLMTTVRNAEPSSSRDPVRRRRVRRPGSRTPRRRRAAAASRTPRSTTMCTVASTPWSRSRPCRGHVVDRAEDEPGDRVGRVGVVRFVVGAGLVLAEDALRLLLDRGLQLRHRSRARSGSVPPTSRRRRSSSGTRARRCWRPRRSADPRPRLAPRRTRRCSGTSPCSATVHSGALRAGLIGRRVARSASLRVVDNRPARTAASVAGNVPRASSPSRPRDEPHRCRRRAMPATFARAVVGTRLGDPLRGFAAASRRRLAGSHPDSSTTAHRGFGATSATRRTRRRPSSTMLRRGIE